MEPPLNLGESRCPTEIKVLYHGTTGSSLSSCSSKRGSGAILRKHGSAATMWHEIGIQQDGRRCEIKKITGHQRKLTAVVLRWVTDQWDLAWTAVEDSNPIQSERRARTWEVPSLV
eukprot:348402-Amphidinium_carterae.1